MKAQMSILCRHQRRRRHTVVAFDDGQRTDFVQTDQQYCASSTVFSGMRQLSAERAKLGKEGVGRPGKPIADAFGGLQQVVAAVGVSPPLIPRKHSNTS